MDLRGIIVANQILNSGYKIATNSIQIMPHLLNIGQMRLRYLTLLSQESRELHWERRPKKMSAAKPVLSLLQKQAAKTIGQLFRYNMADLKIQDKYLRYWRNG
jgi:hypothetical protein